jgi:hydrogenase maturation protease
MEGDVSALRRAEEQARKITVLGLGNTLLTDDGVGLRVLDALTARLSGCGAPGRHPSLSLPWQTESAIEFEGVQVRLVAASAGGFAFIDLLSGADAALIIDAVPAAWVAIRTGGPAMPGQILRSGLEDFPPSTRLACGHEMNLSTAVAYGRVLGLPMPGRVEVLGILVEDVQTFAETCTPLVEAAIGPAVEMAHAILCELVRSARPVAATNVSPATPA